MEMWTRELNTWFCKSGKGLELKSKF
jgi:hypothetical protein